MKKVLVVMASWQDNPLIPIIGFRPPYIKKLLKYDLLPLFIFPGLKKEYIEYMYKQASGVYLMGGQDWNPLYYNQKRHPKTQNNDANRDALEFYILKKLLKDKKPFLGICRGSQGLAIASGGSLHQHIPDSFPQENHNPNSCYDDLLTSQKHRVHIKKNSKIHKILQKDSLMVNSYHHQAVDHPGGNLEIVGTSPAGVVEIIEHSDPNYFCFGVTAHPEAEEKGFMENLFSTFARAQ